MTEKKTAADFIENAAESKRIVDSLAQSNQAKVEALAKEGMQFGPGVIALWKVEALVDTIMTTEDSKLIYRHNFEVTRKKFLEEVMKELRQAKLVEGVHQAKSKLTIPGR